MRMQPVQSTEYTNILIQRHYRQMLNQYTSYLAQLLAPVTLVGLQYPAWPPCLHCSDHAWHTPHPRPPSGLPAGSLWAREASAEQYLHH